LSALGIGVATTSYVVLTTTSNTAIAALPTVLVFAACPAMCAARGGGMWFINKLRKKKDKTMQRNLNEDKSRKLQKTICSEDKSKNQSLESEAAEKNDVSLLRSGGQKDK
jgi:hypothetical protein